MTDGPFGVELPDNFSAPQTEAPQQQESTPQTQTTTEEKIQEILDLEKVPKFKFEGRELTAKELKNEILMRQDYTRKTQEIAKTREELQEQRRYAENFHFDAAKVIKYPYLMSSFEKTYPKQYVESLKLMMGELGRTPQTTEQTQTPQLPDEVLKRLGTVEERFEMMDKQAREAETKAAEVELDRIFDPLTKKYPFADEQAVTARAQMMAEKAKMEGEDLKLDAAFFEKLFKDHHDRNQKAYEQYTKTQIENQKRAAQQAKDIGRGGDVGGIASKEMRSMKDARAALMNEFGG